LNAAPAAQTSANIARLGATRPEVGAADDG